MTIIKSGLFTIISISLNVLLFGQIIFQFLNFHFHLTSISTPLIFLLFFISSIFIFLKSYQLVFNKFDLIFSLFLLYLISSYIITGISDSFEFSIRIILVILGPYIIGRFIGSSIENGLFQIYLIVYFLILFILIFEISQNISLLNQDRFILYDTKEGFGSGSSSQAYISTTFGSALIFSITSFDFKNKLLIRNFILVTSIIVLVLFGSRSSSIAIVLTYIIVYFYTNNFTIIKLLKIILIGFIGILMFILLVPTSRQDFFNESIQGEGSAAIRGFLFLDAWKLLTSAPIFGIGASNFGHLYSFEKADFASPHSLFLHILTELGIIGFLLFISNILYIIYKFNNYIKINTLMKTKYLYPLFAFWLFLILDMQFFGNYFYDYQFYLVTGMLVSNLKKKSIHNYGK